MATAVLRAGILFVHVEQLRRTYGRHDRGEVAKTARG